MSSECGVLIAIEIDGVEEIDEKVEDVVDELIQIDVLLHLRPSEFCDSLYSLRLKDLQVTAGCFGKRLEDLVTLTSEWIMDVWYVKHEKIILSIRVSFFKELLFDGLGCWPEITQSNYSCIIL